MFRIISTCTFEDCTIGVFVCLGNLLEGTQEIQNGPWQLGKQLRATCRLATPPILENSKTLVSSEVIPSF